MCINPDCATRRVIKEEKYMKQHKCSWVYWSALINTNSMSEFKWVDQEEEEYYKGKY